MLGLEVTACWSRAISTQPCVRTQEFSEESLQVVFDDALKAMKINCGREGRRAQDFPQEGVNFALIHIPVGHTAEVKRLASASVRQWH